MKDTQAQNLLPECIFYCLRNIVKNLTENVKTRNIDNILKTARNIAKSLMFQPKALHLGVRIPQGMIIKK